MKKADYLQFLHESVFPLQSNANIPIFVQNRSRLQVKNDSSNTK